MNRTTTEQMMEALVKRFPKAWFKAGKEFSKSGDYDSAVWSGEGSYIGKEEMFKYYTTSSKYIFGVHKKLCDFVERYGYYIESYDGGTYFIFPK